MFYLGLGSVSRMFGLISYTDKSLLHRNFCSKVKPNFPKKCVPKQHKDNGANALTYISDTGIVQNKMFTFKFTSIKYES